METIISYRVYSGVIWGTMEKKTETIILYRVTWGYMGDNGKGNGSKYIIGLYRVI